jgi:DNA polymerase, archaea type
MATDLNELLYGKDPEEKIVAAERNGPNMRVYIRDGDTVRHEDRPYSEFILLTDDAWDRVYESFAGLSLHHADLRGEGKYRHIIAGPPTWEVRTFLEGTDDRDDFSGEGYYHVGNRTIQYLTQTGKTMFKGMDFSDLHRLQFDLEVISPNGNFPRADNPDDEIVIIAVSDNRGLEVVLHTNSRVRRKKTERGTYLRYYETEGEMLTAFVELIHELDPDVIENHNIFGFDLPYLRDRAKYRNVNLALGRNKTSPFWYTRTTKFAEKDIEFENCLISGRHVIDTMFLAMGWDVYARKLQGYGLKYVAQEFKVASENRVYIEGQDITNAWFENPQSLLDYAIDDVREVRALSEALSGSAFYLTQMVPMEYQRVALSGSGAVIESLFVRQYVRMRQALPDREVGRQEGGGYTGTRRRGVFRNLIYADVESLYPSIMLRFNIQPERDTLKIFPQLLQDLTDLRLSTKADMKKYDRGSKDQIELNARQQAYKIIINSFYGYLSWSFGLFNDFSEGERVAATGQKILRAMMSRIEALGYDVVLFDTDGVLFSMGPERLPMEEQLALIEKIQAAMPRGINIGHDGEYDTVFAYKPKNYVLRGYDGDVTVKGNSLKSRGYEKYLVEFQRQLFSLFMDEDYAGINRAYNELRQRIIRGEWDVRDFEKAATLHKGRYEYGDGPKSAAYELAYVEGALDFDAAEGDIVRYFIGQKRKRGQSNYEVARPSSEWVSGAEDTRHYLDRIDTVVKKYASLFTPADFGTLFAKETPNQPQLFPDIATDYGSVRMLTLTTDD